MRLFIAVDFEPSVKKRLAAIRDKARSLCPRANFSPDANLHMTLVFLGDVPEARVRVVMNAMESVKFDPFVLKLHGEEKLGNGLLCMSVYRTSELMSLQARLEEVLLHEGFDIEKREFRPHVTLARRFFVHGSADLSAHIQTTVMRVTLMKSEQINGVQVYTALGHI